MKQTEWGETLYALLSKPMRLEEIDRALPAVSKKELKAALEQLTADGLVMKNKKNRFAQSSHYGCMAGTFLSTGRRFAFVSPIPAAGEEKQPDIFIPPNACGGAWHGDRVLVHLTEGSDRRGRPEGTVISILSRAEKELNGALIQRGKRYYVQPASNKFPEIAVSRQDLGGAGPGDFVAVSVFDYGGGGITPQGRIIADLGEDGTMEASIAAILRENGVTESFPADVLEQADAIPQEVTPTDLNGRLDLRDKLIFTIDGDDARDFDDAVSLERLDNGRWLLGVHIADVSHYVTPHSPLWQEAFRRGTSVYYPGHVIPMLPFALSHGICSLNPDADRLTFSALIELDENGGRHRATFAKSVIRSKARMTYRNVNKILAGDETLRQQYAFLVETAEAMNRLAHTLYDCRVRRGALELEIPEVAISTDANGHPTDVQYRERGDSEKLIEEFMLQANEAVAEYMCLRDYPTVYRVHEDPDPDKLRVFAQFARLFGYRIDPERPGDTFQFQAVLRGVPKDPRQRVLPTLLLRSLARARYAEQCIGHYGLKAKFYLHFTSPIRRYPDLIAHQMLEKALSGERFDETDQNICGEAAQQSTVRELAADTAERNIDKLFIAFYMKRFTGKEFDATITGVQSFGIFVTLANGCEGLLRVELLGDDFFEYHERQMVLQGRYTGKRFCIGDDIRVLLLSASEVTGQVDFAIAGHTPDSAAPARPLHRPRPHHPSDRRHGRPPVRKRR